MPTNILMPALSPTMTEGTLAKWLKKEGDVIKSGQVIAEIETDKATMEVEAADEGVLGKIIVPAGTAGVKVNAPIAVLLADGEKASDIAAAAPVATPAAAPVAVAPAPAAPAPQVKPVASAAAPAAASGERIFATPLAKRIAADKGINLAAIQGTGPHGRITKADVEQGKAGHMPAAAAPAAKPAPAPVAVSPSAVTDLLGKLGQGFTALPNNNIKKVTAKRLLEAKQSIPHFYLTIDCQIDQLLAMRARINASGQKVSVNDFVAGGIDAGAHRQQLER